MKNTITSLKKATKDVVIKAAQANGIDTTGKTKAQIIELIIKAKEDTTVMKNITAQAPEVTLIVAAPKAAELKKVEYVKLHSTAKEICMKKYGMQREMLGKEEYKAFSDFINSEVCKKANYGITVLYKTLMSITDKGKWALVTVQKKGSKAQYNCLFWYEKKEENGKVVQKLGDNVKYVTK